MGPQTVLVTVCRRDERAEICSDRKRHTPELRLDLDATRLGPDRRDPAKPLLDRVPHETGWVGSERGCLARLEEPGNRRPGGMPRLLHPAEQDHLQRRQDRRHPLVERALRVLQHRRDRARVRRLPQAFEDRRELAVDLGAGGIGDDPSRRIVLEVDRALGKTVEPPSQRVTVDLGEAEDAPEREDRDGFEVLTHQIRLATLGDRVQQPFDDRGDDRGRARLDDTWP